MAVALLICCVFYSWRRNNRLSQGNYNELLHVCLKFLNHNFINLSLVISHYYSNLLASLVGESTLSTTPLAFHGHVLRDDSLNGDLPIIPLIVLQQSTDYFSESTKLGQGGFGSVYKV